MSEGAIAISSPRVRAVSFASGALVVTLICLLLLLFSRVVAQLEHAPIAGVQVEIVERTETPRPTRSPRALPSAPSRTSDAPSAGTSIPIDRAMLARTLRCADVGPGASRPPECPPAALSLSVAPDLTAPSRGSSSAPVSWGAAYAGITPPCPECIHFGIVPDPPSRSPEQICREGGLGGPCRQPAFRPEDVARLAHTE